MKIIETKRLDFHKSDQSCKPLLFSRYSAEIQSSHMHFGGVNIMAILDGKTICQVALVVKDIQATAERYAELFDMPVPRITQLSPPEEARTTFRGQPTATRAKLCVFDLGHIVLELTEADDQPSSWKEFMDTHGEGVHHIGFMTEDRDKVMDYFEKNEMPVRHYGEYPGGNYTFMESEEKLGVLINVKYEPGK